MLHAGGTVPQSHARHHNLLGRSDKLADLNLQVMAYPIALRPPTSTNFSEIGDFTPPTTDWLSGTWHVTHSTLPMWKSKRNVTISYEKLPPTAATDGQGPDKFKDIVTYQTLSSDKVKTVNGISTESGSIGAWDWRGKGWLMIASSHWEILGYGDLGEGKQWILTYFAKTLFTPAGIDVYSRTKAGLSEPVLAGIREALAGIKDTGVKRLASEIFEVARN